MPWMQRSGFGALLLGFCGMLAAPALAQVPSICDQLSVELRAPCREAQELIMRDRGPALGRVVQITGRQYGWHYRYSLPQPGAPDRDCIVAGPLTLPAGEQVELQVTSDDIIHDWTVPGLALKLTGIPGRIASTQINPDKAGIFHGGATSTSGSRFGEMTIEVRILERSAYDDWERNVLPGLCLPPQER